MLWELNLHLRNNMDIAEKINGLNGSVVTRQVLQANINQAKKNEQHHIAEKLQSILNEFPKKGSFHLEIVNPQMEIVPDSHLYCLDCEIPTDESNGLAKAVSPNDIYQMMTDKMIQMIKEAKLGDYKKKWKGEKYGKGYTIPFNFDSKKRYRGINVFLLTELEPLENPYFLTFKQIEDNKGSLKKGSKGKPVVYFTQLFKVTDAKRNIDFGTYDKAKALSFASKNGFSPNDIDTIPILKYYNVFNGADIDGIDFDLDNFKVGFIDKEVPAVENNRIDVAELLIENYPKPQVPLKFGGDRAFYSPGKDMIQMPHLADFETVQDYYRTLLHELSHSTGHAKRLARDFGGSFGSKKYAFEELVAEFGATFLSAEAGIIWHNNNNHAAYLKSWNNVLTHLEKDNKFLMKASTMAQKVADFVLQFDEAGNPLYFKDLEKIIKKETEKPAIKPVVQKKPKVSVSKSNKKTAEVKPKPAIVEEPLKVDSQGQIALFGAKKEKLNGSFEVEQPQTVPEVIEVIQPVIINVPERKTIGNIQKIGSQNNQQSEFFTVDGEVGKFLQQVEKKPFGSVVITIDGMQGAGKTTMLYQFMESFADPGNKCLFISGEEDPNSHLAKSKVEKYLTDQARQNIDTVGEVANVNELYSYIEPYDIIFIDSWQKLQRMVGNIRLDEDLRKKFHGKVFVIIFQQTTTGRTKGGAEVVFDGDIIIKMVKESSFELNYAYFDKNRYTLVPIETIRYNIANAKCYNPEAMEENENTEPINLSFTYKEN